MYLIQFLYYLVGEGLSIAVNHHHLNFQSLFQFVKSTFHYEILATALRTHDDKRFAVIDPLAHDELIPLQLNDVYIRGRVRIDELHLLVLELKLDKSVFDHLEIQGRIFVDLNRNAQ